MEVWRQIEGYEGYYEVSTGGRVRSLDRLVEHRTKGQIRWKGRVLKPHTDKLGYQHVQLSRSGAVQQCKVHRLVAGAFLDNPHGLPQVNHLDLNPSNNNANNLEWCDQTRNMAHLSECGAPGRKPKSDLMAPGDLSELIRLARTRACTQKELSKRFGLSKGAIYRLLRIERAAGWVPDKYPFRSRPL